MKFKKILALILATCCIGAMTACNKPTDLEGDPDPDEQVSTPIPSGTLDATQESEIIDIMSDIIEETEDTEETQLFELYNYNGELSAEQYEEFLSIIPDNWLVGDYQEVYSDEYVTISAMPLYVAESAGDIVSVFPAVIWKAENNCDLIVDVNGESDFTTDIGATEGYGNSLDLEVEPNSTVYVNTIFMTCETPDGIMGEDGCIYIYDTINQVSFPFTVDTYDDGDFDTVVQGQAITVDFSVLGTPNYSN